MPTCGVDEGGVSTCLYGVLAGRGLLPFCSHERMYSTSPTIARLIFAVALTIRYFIHVYIYVYVIVPQCRICISVLSLSPPFQGEFVIMLESNLGILTSAHIILTTPILLLK